MAAVGEDENEEEEDVVEGRQAGRRTATSSVQSACEGPTHFKLRNVALLFALSGTADATRSLQSMSTRPQPTPALSSAEIAAHTMPVSTDTLQYDGQDLGDAEERGASRSTPKSPGLPCVDATNSTCPILRHTTATFE